MNGLSKSSMLCAPMDHKVNSNNENKRFAHCRRTATHSSKYQFSFRISFRSDNIITICVETELRKNENYEFKHFVDSHPSQCGQTKQKNERKTQRIVAATSARL